MRVLTVAWLVGVISALVLAACVVSPAAPAEPDMMEEMGPSGPVTLHFLAVTDDDQLNAWREILGEFQQLDDGMYAGVEIEFETVPFRELFPKIESSVAVGLPWDIFQADGPDMKHYGFNRVITPLTDYFNEEEMSQWFPQSIEEGSFRDEFLGPAHHAVLLSDDVQQGHYGRGRHFASLLHRRWLDHGRSLGSLGRHHH